MLRHPRFQPAPVRHTQVRVLVQAELAKHGWRHEDRIAIASKQFELQGCAGEALAFLVFNLRPTDPDWLLSGQFLRGTTYLQVEKDVRLPKTATDDELRELVRRFDQLATQAFQVRKPTTELAESA